jgi:hypothetical protein
MASSTATNVAAVEPKVTMMDGFVTRRTHGSIQSAGTGDASSADQMKFFALGVQHVMQHTQMILRVGVPEQHMDTSVFQGADQLQAKTAMAEEVNDRLRQLLKTKVTPQMVRRSPLQSQHATFIFTVDVTIVNQEAKANANFQQSMRGLTQSGGSLRTLTEAMVSNWEALATTGEASHPGAPRMLFTLEPRSNANMENIAHSVEHTPQELIHTVRELYTRAEEGSPLKASTMERLSGRLAIFASYVAGRTGPTTTLFCLEADLLTYLILQIGALGLMQGSWTSQAVAVPIRTIGGGVTADQSGRVLARDQSGLPLIFTDEEKSYGRMEPCLRFPRFDRGAACSPADNLSFRWCGRNVTDVWTTLAFMLTDHSNTTSTQLPATLHTVDGWMERIHVATDRNGNITRVVIAATHGEVTSVIFEALQGQQLACTPNGDPVMLAFGPGRCSACRPWKCQSCGSNGHARGDCPNNRLAWAQKIIPCALCGKPTGGHNTHTLETCDVHLQVNDPAKQLGCPVCTHKGHSATQCPVWRGANGVMHVPNLLTSVLAQFPDWQIIMPNAIPCSTEGSKRAWYNTGTVSINVLPVTPILETQTYADMLRSCTPSPGASTSGSERGFSRLERWTAGSGANDELMKLATSLCAKMEEVAASVEGIRKVQDLQTRGMELLHSSADAQTTAIGKLQAAETKHTAFYEQLQKAHQAAMALNASSSPEEMEEDLNVTTIPSEDSMAATGQ